MRQTWYYDALMYQVDPSLFQDTNGDGWGDLPGVTARLNHLRDLGVTCMWLMPFYASPWRDAGYDVSDHMKVDPRFGDPSDVVELFDHAEELGIRVIIDLITQHTSDQHRWFQGARQDRDSPYRDYYIWSDEPVETDARPVFPDVEDSVWAWDDEAQQYYRHLFYSHQPDLDVANPRVRREIERIMIYWLRLGASGFRVDAAPYVVQRAREADPADGGMWLLNEFRDLVTLYRPGGLLMGEVDVPPRSYADYFGDDNRMNLLLNFWNNNNLFLALARRDAEPLARALREQPTPPANSRYVTWLRNHDELDLQRLSDSEREEVMRVFAPEDDMRIYRRGIRRRLAPMLGGDERWLALAHAMLMSLPGVPILRYGEEIGMGDDLSRPERWSVRTPMQWSDESNAGFSSAPSERLPAQVINDGDFGYKKVNVYAQSLRDDSLLSKIGKMLRARLGLTGVGAGACTVLDVGQRCVFALRHDHDNATIVTLANLAPEAVDFELPHEDITELVDVFADSDYGSSRGGTKTMRLEPYGYRWLRRRQHARG